MPTQLDEAAGKLIDAWVGRRTRILLRHAAPDAKLIRGLRRISHPFGRAVTACRMLEFDLREWYHSADRRNVFSWIRPGTGMSDWRAAFPRGNIYRGVYDALFAFWEWFNSQNAGWRWRVLSGTFFEDRPE